MIALIAPAFALVGCGITQKKWDTRKVNDFIYSDFLLTKQFGTPIVSHGDFQVLRDPGTNGGFLRGPKTGQAHEFEYQLSADTPVNDLVDFLLGLMAEQQYVNIGIANGTNPYERQLFGARWNGKVGYTARIVVFLDEKPWRLEGEPARNGPVLSVTFAFVTTQNFYDPTNEAPAYIAKSEDEAIIYPFERMTAILKPFGLTPFRAPPNFVFPFDLQGRREKGRTHPPYATNP